MDPAARRQRLIIRGAGLVIVISAWFFVKFRRLARSNRCISYGPMSQRDQERNANLRFIYNSDDINCVELLRMKRAPFFQLCDLFRTRGLLKDSIHTTIEEQLAMFLHVVGHNQRFRVIKFSFRRSIETISRYFQEVLFAVGELRAEMIVPPSSAVPAKIQHSRRWNPFFKVMARFYVVFKGRCPGLYDNWPQCHAQVDRFPNNLYQGFKTWEEASMAWKLYKLEADREAELSAVIEAAGKVPVKADSFLNKNFVISVLVFVVLVQMVLIVTK